jgi:AAA15 family ATPase/GTPase
MLTLSIKSVGPIRLESSKDIKISKTVLYGYNGAGKSCIIRVLAMFLCGEECVPELGKEGMDTFKKSLDVRLTSKSGFIGFKYEYVAGDNNEVKFRGNVINRELIQRYIGSYRVARVLTDHLYFGSSEVVNVFDTYKLLEVLEDVEFIEKVRDFFKYLDPGVSDFYYKKFKDSENGKWLPIELLPYGYKRALTLLYAVDKYDAVFIEGFETGLHVDLIRELIDFISENYKDKVVVIEAHLGTLLRFSLMREWYVYYISREGIEEINLQRLHTMELFSRELEALKS